VEALAGCEERSALGKYQEQAAPEYQQRDMPACTVGVVLCVKVVSESDRGSQIEDVN